MLFLVVGTPWKRPRSRAFAAPTAVMAGSAAYPLPDSNVTNATAKFLWERVEHLLDYLDEMFTLHPSPNEMARSLRVAVVVFVVIIVILFAVAFVFLFVLVWLLSKEDIGRYRPIRRV